MYVNNHLSTLCVKNFMYLVKLMNNRQNRNENKQEGNKIYRIWKVVFVMVTLNSLQVIKNVEKT